MMKAIVGFKIEITAPEAVFALSRGKSVEDQKSIIAHPEKRNTGGDAFIAAEMKKQLS